MGRFSSRLAPVFADFAGVEPGMRALDVGAGTGALTAELVRRDAAAGAIEPSPAFVAALRSRYPGVDVREGGAEELPWPDDSFDVALAQLVIAFMSDAPAGLREMRRVAGTVAVCMWDRDGMEMLAALNRTRDALGVAREDAPYRSREEMSSSSARAQRWSCSRWTPTTRTSRTSGPRCWAEPAPPARGRPLSTTSSGRSRARSCIASWTNRTARSR